MGDHNLPDFQTCLKFSVAAKMSFLCMYREGVVEEKLASSTPSACDIQLKKAIDKIYPAGGIKVTVMNSTTASLDSLSTAHVQDFEIVIIPDINSLSQPDQAKLVKTMRDCKMAAEKEQAGRIFIGVVRWDNQAAPSSAAKDGDDESTAPPKTRIFLPPCIHIDSWLKHKFWFACAPPRLNFESSSESSISTETTKEEDQEAEERRSTVLNEEANLDDVFVGSNVKRYILDIMVHLRTHRLTYNAKAGGIYTSSLDNVILLSRLIGLHSGKMFVSPSHVKEASMWYFPMHLELVQRSSMDSSLLYGSDPKLVDEMLEKLAKIRYEEVSEFENPLFLESLVVKNVLSKVVPPV
ncbi:YKL098W [Saccharomyces arboricola H-6]|uniref:YKL098W n=1 Tax=Saccharomyces arboricola (strain H-6 / AS 2.3317 / CBS 10644) TaxID=1160507 RepID=J8Q005_SACAR|nr:YKL098W [Saccharomyces arboricola H-6]